MRRRKDLNYNLYEAIIPKKNNRITGATADDGRNLMTCAIKSNKMRMSIERGVVVHFEALTWGKPASADDIAGKFATINRNLENSWIFYL